MKKILLSAAMGSLFFTANADQTVVTAHEEPAVIIEQAPIEEVCECTFGGIYAGLGIGGSFYKNKYKNAAEELKTKNINRFVGTVALGAGKVFKDVFYVGLEGMMDFTKSKKHDMHRQNGDLYGFSLKNSGIVSSIGLRAGYVVNSINTLVYGKVAASHASCKVVENANGNKKESSSKFAPALALGVEKAFCKKFTARLEGEYRFESKKDGLKANKGFTVRSLLAYHVKI